LLVMATAFRELRLSQMRACETAMREGILHDMLGRSQNRDPRDAAIAAMALRYGVDTEHAARVETMALALFDQVQDAWDLDDDDRLMLGWAARLHELGLAISHSQHQKHAAYVIANSDIDGFSRQEQTALAALVRCQRRSLSRSLLSGLSGRAARAALRCAVLLRLAILLCRSHAIELPSLSLGASEDRIQLAIPCTWLAAHALARADLATEREELAAIGLDFSVGTLK
jgi:exopolyphosphatase/guanosine-5'-triphosphate,3'-diphosphate pyrophosphatase